MKRAHARWAIPLVLCTPTLGKQAPVPLDVTVRIETAYTGQPNKAAYLEDLRSLILQTLVGEDCFRSVIMEGNADVVLRVRIDRLEVSEQKRFDASPAGGAGSFTLLAASATISGTVSLESADGTAIVSPKKFFQTIQEAPLTPQYDATGRAVEQALKEPVRWIDRYICRKRETVRKHLPTSSRPRPLP